MKMHTFAGVDGNPVPISSCITMVVSPEVAEARERAATLACLFEENGLAIANARTQFHRVEQPRLRMQQQQFYADRLREVFTSEVFPHSENLSEQSRLRLVEIMNEFLPPVESETIDPIVSVACLSTFINNPTIDTAMEVFDKCSYEMMVPTDDIDVTAWYMISAAAMTRASQHCVHARSSYDNGELGDAKEALEEAKKAIGKWTLFLQRVGAVMASQPKATKAAELALIEAAHEEIKALSVQLSTIKVTANTLAMAINKYEVEIVANPPMLAFQVKALRMNLLHESRTLAQQHADRESKRQAREAELMADNLARQTVQLAKQEKEAAKIEATNARESAIDAQANADHTETLLMTLLAEVEPEVDAVDAARAALEAARLEVEVAIELAKTTDTLYEMATSNEQAARQHAHEHRFDYIVPVDNRVAAAAVTESAKSPDESPPVPAPTFHPFSGISITNPRARDGNSYANCNRVENLITNMATKKQLDPATFITYARGHDASVLPTRGRDGSVVRLTRTQFLLQYLPRQDVATLLFGAVITLHFPAHNENKFVFNTPERDLCEDFTVCLFAVEFLAESENFDYTTTMKNFIENGGAAELKDRLLQQTTTAGRMVHLEAINRVYNAFKQAAKASSVSWEKERYYDPQTFRATDSMSLVEKLENMEAMFCSRHATSTEVQRDPSKQLTPAEIHKLLLYSVALGAADIRDIKSELFIPDAVFSRYIRGKVRLADRRTE